MAGYLFDYEDKVWGGETLRLNPSHFRATRLLYFLDAIKHVKKGRVLDVGCGAGDFVEAVKFYRPELEYYGCDISKKAVAIAKKRVKGAEFTVADAEKLPYKKDFFDIIMCFDVIEHVENPYKAVAEARRVLKKGGIYHAYIPAEGNIYILEGILIKLGWKAKEKYGAHFHHYSTVDIKDFYSKNNLRLKKMIWGDHLIQQLLEIGYFTMLTLRGKNAEYSVEGYLGLQKPTLGIKTLRFIKNVFATASYYESRLSSRLPGIGLHLTSIKP